MSEEVMGMDMLASYLKAVRRYLPRKHRDDIVAELSEELLAQMDARQNELGRPLSESERMTILRDYGDPMLVARRYCQDARSLTVGWELIGPELFPMYMIILSLNVGLSLVVAIAIYFYLHQPISVGVLFRTALIQVVIVTLTFCILNLVRHKCPQPWYYPPAELAPMIPIAPWYSISGLCVFGAFGLWWAAVPFFPKLLFGSASHSLELAPSWHRFYLPVLILVAISVAQRAVNLARPTWSGLLPASRFLVNALGLALQYPMIKGYPYVVVATAASQPDHAHQIADAINNTILWGALSWVWLYCLISAGIYAWYCAPHLRRLIRRMSNHMPLEHTTKGII